eukprot:15351636-Ditylum_brightwellii.AAC.2
MLPDQLGTRHPRKEKNSILLSFSVKRESGISLFRRDEKSSDCVWYLYAYCNLQMSSLSCSPKIGSSSIDEIIPA